MLKIYFLFMTFMSKIYAATIDIENAIEPTESITVALTGKFVAIIMTLALVFVGYSYMFGQNDEKQKERLIQIMKGGVLILVSSSIAAIFG
ncbi:TrbC/VirB2 family protein [Sulfurimonas sp.]|uniref:TrbC/VirB2 family protein n=2 Tax=Sulfurimonas sp. TaxID=2022749 RepID=UPI003C7877B7